MNRSDLICFTAMLRRTTCAQVGVESPWVVKYLKSKKDKKNSSSNDIFIYIQGKARIRNYKFKKKMYIYTLRKCKKIINLFTRSADILYIKKYAWKK